MYLRPGNLLKAFWVERNETRMDSVGNPRVEYRRVEDSPVRGVLAEAKPEEKERWSQIAHPITHLITQRGRPQAKPGDRLVHHSRVFYIQGVDNIGELNIATLYYAEERVDLNGNSTERS